jgi:hypothetical protein
MDRTGSTCGILAISILTVRDREKNDSPNILSGEECRTLSFPHNTRLESPFIYLILHRRVEKLAKITRGYLKYLKGRGMVLFAIDEGAW